MGRYVTESIFFIDIEIVHSKKTQETDVPKKKAIRNLISYQNDCLPQNWINFLACPRNKADYEHFLSK